MNITYGAIIPYESNRLHTFYQSFKKPDSKFIILLSSKKLNIFRFLTCVHKIDFALNWNSFASD